jgi:hypothetical protein
MGLILEVVPERSNPCKAILRNCNCVPLSLLLFGGSTMLVSIRIWFGTASKES